MSLITNNELLQDLYDKIKPSKPNTPNKPNKPQNPILNPTREIMEITKQDKADMEAAIKRGYNPHLTKTTTIKNNLYQGDTYFIKFDEYNVTITNKTKKYTKKLNLSNLLRGMNQNDKINFLKKIQTLPAEVLEDLAVECDRIQSSSGQNMNINPNNPNFTAGGYYTPQKDSIVTAPRHLVHELGHALDYQGVGNMNGDNNNSAIMKNKKFLKAFNIGLKRYAEAGGKQYNYKDESTWPSGKDQRNKKSNYCTANPRELWAEIYTAMMTGTCQSLETITKYFPEAIKVGKEFLQEVRSESSPNRHNTPIRDVLSVLG